MNENVINLFGNHLADLIKKPAIACKGLIRFSIKEYFKTNGHEESKQVSHSDFLEILRINIRDRLIMANIPDINDILMRLETIVNIEQAIFSMTT